MSRGKTLDIFVLNFQLVVNLSETSCYLYKEIILQSNNVTIKPCICMPFVLRYFTNKVSNVSMNRSAAAESSWRTPNSKSKY